MDTTETPVQLVDPSNQEIPNPNATFVEIGRPVTPSELEIAEEVKRKSREQSIRRVAEIYEQHAGNFPKGLSLIEQVRQFPLHLMV